VLWILSSLKIHRPQPGLNLQTLGPMASKLTTWPSPRATSCPFLKVLLVYKPAARTVTFYWLTLFHESNTIVTYFTGSSPQITTCTFLLDEQRTDLIIMNDNDLPIPRDAQSYADRKMVSRFRSQNSEQLFMCCAVQVQATWWADPQSKTPCLNNNSFIIRGQTSNHYVAPRETTFDFLMMFNNTTVLKR
jgi:hypothetical protein